jgi:hypothetical protein
MHSQIVTRTTVDRDQLVLQLTGLVHVRALLESRCASLEEVAAHTDAIARVRAELAALGGDLR